MCFFSFLWKNRTTKEHNVKQRQSCFSFFWWHKTTTKQDHVLFFIWKHRTTKENNVKQRPSCFSFLCRSRTSKESNVKQGFCFFLNLLVTQDNKVISQSTVHILFGTTEQHEHVQKRSNVVSVSYCLLHRTQNRKSCFFFGRNWETGTGT